METDKGLRVLGAYGKIGRGLWGIGVYGKMDRVLWRIDPYPNLDWGLWLWVAASINQDIEVYLQYTRVYAARGLSIPS